MIFQMSGHRDPSRMCTKEMPHEEVAYMVNYLASCDLNEEWQFGKELYSRAAPPPLVIRFLFLFLSDFFVAESVLSDLTNRLWSEPPPPASSRHHRAGPRIPPRPGGE